MVFRIFFSQFMNFCTSYSSNKSLQRDLTVYKFLFGSRTRQIPPNCPSAILFTYVRSEMFKLAVCRRIWFQKQGTIFSLFFSTFFITSSQDTPPIASKKTVSVIQANTPQVCITISSSRIFDLLAYVRNQSPQHCPLLATIVPFFCFLRLPSIKTTIFWKPATPFRKIGSLALKDEIFIDSITLSVCALLNLLSRGFFSNAHLMKFLKVTSQTLSLSTLLRVSLPSTRQVTSSSALMVSCLMVLQQSDCSPKESPLVNFLMNLEPLQTDDSPYLMQQSEDPGSPSWIII